MHTTKRGRGRPARSHDNRACRSFASQFFHARDMVQEHPQAGDILAGIMSACTAGDTSRGLSRTMMFLILRGLDNISTSSVQALLGDSYAERTCRKYGLAAIVASMALATYAQALPAAQAERDMDEWLDALSYAQA